MRWFERLNENILKWKLCASFEGRGFNRCQHFFGFPIAFIQNIFDIWCSCAQDTHVTTVRGTMRLLPPPHSTPVRRVRSLDRLTVAFAGVVLYDVDRRRTLCT